MRKNTTLPSSLFCCMFNGVVRACTRPLVVLVAQGGVAQAAATIRRCMWAPHTACRQQDETTFIC